MSYQAIATLAGQQALAAALNGESALTVARMVVGDGAGHPLETQVGLRNLRATVAVSSAVRDGNMVTFTGELDENIGGFTVREAGLLDADGRLLFVASLPPIEKATTAENAYDILTLGLMVVVSETASVTVQIPQRGLVTVPGLMRAPFIAVNSIDVSIPPAAPDIGDLYLAPNNATGAWLSERGRLAQWDGSAWIFKAAAEGTIIGTADTGEYWRRTATGWDRWIASTESYGLTRLATGAEVSGGERTDVAVSPADLRSRVPSAAALLFYGSL